MIEKLLNMPKNQRRPYTDVLLVTYLPTDFFVSVAKSVSHWFLIISIQFLTHIAYNRATCRNLTAKKELVSEFGLKH